MIQVIPHTLHFKFHAGTSRGVYTTRKIWLLKLNSEKNPNFTAWGECAPLPQLSCDEDKGNYQEILTRFSHSFDLKKPNFEALRNYPSMLFGFETVFLHHKAQSLKFYDTPFSREEKGIAINGLIWMGQFEEMLQRLEKKLQQGFKCIKIKIGAINFEDELTLLKLIRQRFSPQDIELRVDANGAFKPQEALSKLEKLAAFHLHSIEQPIRAGQWKEMAELCRQTPLPIALDEELIGINKLTEKEELLNTIHPQYIILKPSLHGGFMGSEEWIKLAEERNIDYWVTSALESNIGLNAIAQWAATKTCPRPQGLGTGQLFTDNIPSPLYIEGQYLKFHANDRNGFTTIS